MIHDLTQSINYNETLNEIMPTTQAREKPMSGRINIMLETDYNYTTDREVRRGKYDPSDLIYSGDIDGDGEDDLFYVPMTIKDAKIDKLDLKNAEVKLTTTGEQKRIELESNSAKEAWDATVYVDGQATQAPTMLRAVISTLSIHATNRAK